MKANRISKGKSILVGALAIGMLLSGCASSAGSNPLSADETQDLRFEETNANQWYYPSCKKLHDADVLPYPSSADDDLLRSDLALTVEKIVNNLPYDEWELMLQDIQSEKRDEDYTSWYSVPMDVSMQIGVLDKETIGKDSAKQPLTVGDAVTALYRLGLRTEAITDEELVSLGVEERTITQRASDADHALRWAEQTDLLTDYDGKALASEDSLSYAEFAVMLDRFWDSSLQNHRALRRIFFVDTDHVKEIDTAYRSDKEEPKDEDDRAYTDAQSIAAIAEKLNDFRIANLELEELAPEEYRELSVDYPVADTDAMSGQEGYQISITDGLYYAVHNGTIIPQYYSLKLYGEDPQSPFGAEWMDQYWS